MLKNFAYVDIGDEISRIHKKINAVNGKVTFVVVATGTLIFYLYKKLKNCEETNSYLKDILRKHEEYFLKDDERLKKLEKKE